MTVEERDRIMVALELRPNDYWRILTDWLLRRQQHEGEQEPAQSLPRSSDAR